MSLLSRLFGKTPTAPDPVLHKDFRIFPAPIREGGVYRIAARIEKDIAGTTQIHHLIRADTSPTLDDATSAALAKARQAIDQLGESLFP